jgi:hypothetical protein
VRTISLLILSLSAVAISTGAQAPAGTPDGFVQTFLTDRMGFSAGDLADVAEGRAVAKTMHSEDGQDVSIFGAVRIAAPVETFVAMLRNIVSYEQQLKIKEVGKFHEPPRLDDLAGVTLDAEDVAELQRCRPGRCEVQVPAWALERFHTEIDWRARDATARANDVFRQALFEILGRYRQGGTGALTPYVDRDPPLSLTDEFSRLGAPWGMPVELPELVRYLSNFPRAPLPGSEEFYYWNKGEFGMKPTTRLNQLTIYPVPGAGSRADGVRYVIATKQVYSNHYFSATLELRTVVDDTARPGRGFYLLYTTRSRVSGLSGFIGTLIRGIVRGRARSGMERYLAGTKRVVENAAPRF